MRLAASLEVARSARPRHAEFIGVNLSPSRWQPARHTIRAQSSSARCKARVRKHDRRLATDDPQTALLRQHAAAATPGDPQAGLGRGGRRSRGAWRERADRYLEHRAAVDLRSVGGWWQRLALRQPTSVRSGLWRDREMARTGRRGAGGISTCKGRAAHISGRAPRAPAHLPPAARRRSPRPVELLSARESGKKPSSGSGEGGSRPAARVKPRHWTCGSSANRSQRQGSAGQKLPRT